MKTTLKRLSVCGCGFPTLNARNQLGTEYDIDPDQMVEATYTCGGCNTAQKIKAVWGEASKTGRAGYLPLQIFEEPLVVTHPKTLRSPAPWQRQP